MELSAYYILLEDSCATQISKPDQALLYVSAGSLWIVKEQQDVSDCPNQNHSTHQESLLYLKSCELINVYLSCHRKALLPVSEIEFELLLAIDSFAERKKVSTETSLLQIGREIYDRYLDQFVSGQMCEIFVTISNYHGLPDKTCGLIQYVGTLPACPGIWFGVKLPFVYKGFGASDGSFKGKRFFECDENCGLFLTIDKISVYYPQKGFEDSDQTEDASSSKTDVVSICESPPRRTLASSLVKPPIELGERIVWISDDGPELGTVRWIGVLPDARVVEYTIGVEFDKPIGTGTGKYNNEQLFRAAQNHASLIPVLGLMKAEEFFGSKAAFPEASAHLDAESATFLKSNYFEISHSSDPSDVGSSGDSTTQLGSRPVKIDIKASQSSNRFASGSTEVGPSSATEGIRSGAQSVAKLRRKADAPEHCYENVEKDETGRVLNRDSNAFQVGADARRSCQTSDYLEYHPQAAPTCFRRSFDDIYAENKRTSRFGVAIKDAEYDRVDSLRSPDANARRSLNDSEIRSRTLETYSTARSLACKVFDESDVPSRLPYTTGRSTFYGRADDDSLHARSDEVRFGKSASTPSSKPHRSILKFISKRTPNVILQQINKTLRTSFLPQSFHRRSSSDSAPTLPEQSTVARNNPLSFSHCGRSAGLQEEDKISEDHYGNEDAPQVPPPSDDQTTWKARDVQVRVAAKSPLPQTLEANVTVSGSNFAASNSTYPKSSRSAVTFQPRSNSTVRTESVRRERSFSEFDIGSQVEVDLDGRSCYGIVRWMGCFKNRSDILVGLELEEEHNTCTDGKIGGRRFFSCPPGRAYFTFLHSVKKSSRPHPYLHFVDAASKSDFPTGTMYTPLCFEDLDCLSSSLSTKNARSPADVQPFAYTHVDVVLFSMFAFTQAFDSILLGRRCGESEEISDVRRSLLVQVVNPLRCGQSVNAAKIDCLERFIGHAVSPKSNSEPINAGPAQFFTYLMDELKVDPLLTFSSGSTAHMWSIALPEESFVNPSVQHLLEISFFRANLKLSQVPSCLVLHVRRKSREFVIPTIELDVTDILQNGLRECNICGKPATQECRDCFEYAHLLSSTVFCDTCSTQFHSHAKRTNHKPLPVGVTFDRSQAMSKLTGSGSADEMREKLELCAVVCSQEFHCVGFVKAGLSATAPWVFFSNANPESGLIQPQVGICTFLPNLISESSTSHLVTLSRTEMPPLMQRFFFNADIFMYQFPTLLLYK